jgi:ectoine hydroxylase-related dioxygenase (phytanoyl-CoA dioxygenase family)
MIPGSHRKMLAPQTKHHARGFAHHFDEDSLKEMPVETLAVKRGDAVFCHDLPIHASHPNMSGADRWSLISTYRDSSVKDDSAIGKTAMAVSGKSVNVAV